MLNSPTDIKVNTDGVIYVADSTAGGYGSHSRLPGRGRSRESHDVPPQTTYTSPGAVTGLGIIP